VPWTGAGLGGSASTQGAACGSWWFVASGGCAPWTEAASIGHPWQDAPAGNWWAPAASEWGSVWEDAARGWQSSRQGTVSASHADTAPSKGWKGSKAGKGCSHYQGGKGSKASEGCRDIQGDKAASGTRDSQGSKASKDNRDSQGSRAGKAGHETQGGKAIQGSRASQGGSQAIQGSRDSQGGKAGKAGKASKADHYTQGGQAIKGSRGRGGKTLRGYQLGKPVKMPTVHGTNFQPLRPPGEFMSLLWPGTVAACFPGTTWGALQKSAEALGVAITLRGRKEGHRRAHRPCRLTLLGPVGCTAIIAEECIEAAPGLAFSLNTLHTPLHAGHQAQVAPRLAETIQG